MTNIGMVLPEPGYWAQAAALIRRHGSLLVMDETHTLSSGPGGYARAHGIAADAVVVGKAIGGGMPCAAYGFSAELAAQAEAAKRAAAPGHSGIGNLLAMAAMRATLGTFLRPEVFVPMHARAAALAQGLQALIRRHRLPWCVTQVGARTEFQFCARPPRNGSEAGAAMDADLEHALHLYLLNRGRRGGPAGHHGRRRGCPIRDLARPAGSDRPPDPCGPGRLGSTGQAGEDFGPCASCAARRGQAVCGHGAHGDGELDHSGIIREIRRFQGLPVTDCV